MKRGNRRAVYRWVKLGRFGRTYRIFQYFRFGVSQPAIVTHGRDRRLAFLTANHRDRNRGRHWNRKFFS